MFTHPDQPVSRNYKTKEQAVVDFVRTVFPDIDWTQDRKVYDGCSKRRPDLTADLGHQVLFVEVDENQHTDYDCSCENRRIMELSQDTGHRPVVFIRFNPDGYVCRGQRIASCWGTTKQGICVVKQTKRGEWEARLAALLQSITYWCVHATDKTVEVVQLFYDC